MWNIDRYVDRSARQYSLVRQEWNLESAERNLSTLLGPEGSVACNAFNADQRSSRHRR